MKIRTAGLVFITLIATGCASSTGEGTTTDWGSNSFVNAADLGNGQWLLTCTNSASACTKRASKICANGYDVLDVDSDRATGAAGSLSGFAVTQRKDYEMLVECADATLE